MYTGIFLLCACSLNADCEFASSAAHGHLAILLLWITPPFDTQKLSNVPLQVAVMCRADAKPACMPVMLSLAYLLRHPLKASTAGKPVMLVENARPAYDLFCPQIQCSCISEIARPSHPQFECTWMRLQLSMAVLSCLSAQLRTAWQLQHCSCSLLELTRTLP